MLPNRGELEAEDLLKIILLLVIVWIVVEILGALIEAVGVLLGPFDSLLGLVILVLIVLWLMDRI